MHRLPTHASQTPSLVPITYFPCTPAPNTWCKHLSPTPPTSTALHNCLHTHRLPHTSCLTRLHLCTTAPYQPKATTLIHKQPQGIMPPHHPPRGPPSLPPSLQPWLEPITSPRFASPSPTLGPRGGSRAAHLCPSLTAHGHMLGPPGPLHRHPPRLCCPQVTELREPRAPWDLGLGARGVRVPVDSPLGAPGPQRAGAGMGAGRRAPGSALLRGRGGGLEGRRQRPARKPCHPRRVGTSGRLRGRWALTPHPRAQAPKRCGVEGAPLILQGLSGSAPPPPPPLRHSSCPIIITATAANCVHCSQCRAWTQARLFLARTEETPSFTVLVYAGGNRRREVGHLPGSLPLVH